MGFSRRLTEKERRTMEFLAQGRTYYQVARLEGVSRGGIKHRVESIFNKFGVDTRLEALACYLNVRRKV